LFLGHKQKKKSSCPVLPIPNCTHRHSFWSMLLQPARLSRLARNLGNLSNLGVGTEFRLAEVTPFYR
jgi:hypothetical protein